MNLLQEQPLAWLAVGYLVGAIPVGLLIARARGIDLRKVGSGNIGATNAVRAMGPRWGLFVFALDVLKAYVPVMLATQALGDLPLAERVVAGVALLTVVGHIFPVYLGFRGGKGVACAFGAFAALDPAMAGAGLVLYLQSLILTRSSAVGSLTAVTAMTLTAWIAQRGEGLRFLAIAICLLIWVRHRTNIRELIADARQRKSARAQTPSA